MNKLNLSIAGTHKDLKEKKYSVTELVKYYLARIAKYDKNLNSFLTVTTDYALKAARKQDNLLVSQGEGVFEDFPLFGVVTAFKDLYLTEGIRTTAASRVLENFIPQYSSTVVKKLENAGCILIGKTNCDAWAHGASGENSDFGPIKNPWNKDFVPGGSSSGSAVSVASDFCLVALGTDTGGSVRQPASFCGVTGLKPTYGLVSRFGVVAMASSLDCMGHLTNNVGDSRRVLEVTKGQDQFDSNIQSVKLAGEVRDIKKITIGLPKDYFGQGLDNQVRTKVLAAARFFEKQGAKIVDVDLPHTKYATSVYYIIQPAEVASNLGRYDGIRYGLSRDSFGDEAKRRIMLGSYVLSSGYYDRYYLKAARVRTKLIEDFDKAFAKVDVLLAPVSPTPPFKLGEKTADPLSMYLADVYTVSANLVGVPGLALPAGFSDQGLPIGFQLISQKFHENMLFDLGEIFQRNTDYHSQKPKL
ncbi:glutaminyl-tRNA synthase (glutamine-hydrolyzing) subunit A [Candidatus Woesebacteria bacterium RIFCSPHIGHO2_02_FULL_42_20]|uniref:Glutamyl-tRNA(Gln) amidotransferase subunit A n=1 Tax=Candidatus Woesebacteria bacterium RIFCSPHIGHO2_12_FULL_41_24 TaxID=1802510 RepID=A0A1F8AQ56_9BACT|nr:MAG: glutaminyl-tRNA synthase (glutamine-hydrolyzing) subunit A [Candidatus Woesebacteria bacterium RBG_16_41_13]OGM30697.1 MAG: glutaminyl-tRNA synthase (glutamine-hydrolyzing) subunit A [Candidatus Woesebacteria bacterium RIFCSPHIGHO2_01_FULL_42_80]OGM35834.1 MAG: glutaminyl-tRNA synthase (glutamine-hydrolyzing) subunit A [Candidatus Woesebacteria bacterium RIFCSPHIGHO2_02_FULL_42_20]OGM53892.1 MAG: glutaminyl-tRNA synthase (glutamine-hydrolyzing) subunit A [Candidatus Woesebacteria bacteri